MTLIYSIGLHPWILFPTRKQIGLQRVRLALTPRKMESELAETVVFRFRAGSTHPTFSNHIGVASILDFLFYQSSSLYMSSRNPKRGASSTSAVSAASDSTPKTHAEIYQALLDDLKTVYRTKIKPLETNYSFETFHSAALTDRDIDAKPMVLLIGQYSTGKTTFIKHLIGKSYPGAHVGMEPTTDRFVAVMDGAEERVIPGNAAAVSGELPFGGLQRFGATLLSKFQVAQVSSPILEHMTLVDTPGILSGDKQRAESRGYDFDDVTGWFAERSDLILLLFDGHKLDISDEFKTTISRLRGHEDKVRVVLNKCDQVSGQQLLRVYGALMWALGKVVNSPEVMRVYLGSFWAEPPPTRYEDLRVLLDAEQQDLLRDLEDLPKNAAVRKVNEIVKRARLAKVHAFIIGHLRNEMPSLFGKQTRQKELLQNLEQEFLMVQQRHSLAQGDFPNVERYRECLLGFRFNEFNALSSRLVAAVDDALSSDFPRIMNKFPQSTSFSYAFCITCIDCFPSDTAMSLTQPKANPFALNAPQSPPAYEELSLDERETYTRQFRELTKDGSGSIAGGAPRLSGQQARPIMIETGLPNEVLARVWRVADWDSDGWLDEGQFVVAMHYCKVAKAGGEIPDKVPQALLPGGRHG